MKKTVCQVTRGCTHCGTCVYECPEEAIEMSQNGAVVNPEICVGCGVCVDHCASEALTMTTIDVE